MQQEPLDLLAALLADSPDPELVRNPVTWEVIRRNSARHGVRQLVAWTARPWLSGQEKDWCDRVLIQSWSRHQENLKHLGAALATLGEAGVPVIVMKGPLLAQRHYQPAALRKPSIDLDLAVRNQDLEKAVQALSKLGYGALRSLAESRARSHHVEMSVSSGPAVELHFRLSHGAYGIPVEEFFERATTYPLADGNVALVLSPADELLHLILHRAHGRFALLFHLYEIRRLWKAASPGVRLEVLRRAEAHHFAGALTLTDAAFRVRWNEPLLSDGLKVKPTWLVSQIDDDLYRTFERLSDPGRDLPLSARLARRWLDLKLTDAPSDALRFLAILSRVAWFQLWRAGWRTVRVQAGNRGA